MGLVWSYVKRPLRNFNVDNRALKLISKDKPTPAPKRKVDVEALQKILKDYPEIVKEYSTKNENLDERLKSVYVTSHDSIIQETSNTTEKLPQNRNVYDFVEPELDEPDVIKPGFITLRNVFKVLVEKRDNPEYKVHLEATKYNLDPNVLANIIKYYGSFYIHEPKKKKNQNSILFEPVLFHHDLEKQKPKKIE